MTQIKTALAGNPNSGKTTLFNALTGSRQHVGNYPGVTVEKKVGSYDIDGYHMAIIDLPGTYSLTAYSLEEVVARNFLVDENPDVVIHIIDASNLERNLYLTLQFLEMGVPLCIALNMMDMAMDRGIEIDIKKLSDLLGVPVVPTIARSGKGIEDLMRKAVQLAVGDNGCFPLKISYGNDIDTALDQMESEINSHHFMTDMYPARWLALKYMESDEQILAKGQKTEPAVSERLQDVVKKVTKHLRETLDTYPEALIADQRYGYINAIMKQGVIHHQRGLDRLYTSDKVDKIVTNRLLGPIIMIGVVLLLYNFTFTLSEIPVSWLESLFSWLSKTGSALLPDGLLKSLLISGIVDGVGGVLGFVPLIMFMFLGISVLEDSGYLARVAFMLDKIFSVFGLHGSSVIPFIISGGIAGGCAVPGVMATRTLKSPKERLATLLTVPFMNCGAKLPVFALLVAAFFKENEAAMLFLITLISWMGALLVAKFFRITVIRGESTPFVMELPPYRWPTLKGSFIHTWERTWGYIRKAGTLILAVSVLLWAMMTFPELPEEHHVFFNNQRKIVLSDVPPHVLEELEKRTDTAVIPVEHQYLKDSIRKIDMQETEATLKYSFAGRIGTALENITYLAGFDWRTNIALLGGFAAKEVVVSSLGTAYSLGEIHSEGHHSLAEKLSKTSDWRSLTALSLIVFVLFYAPCFVTVMCIVKETGTWKWGLFSIAFNTLLAFVLSSFIFQVGSAMGY